MLCWILGIDFSLSLFSILSLARMNGAAVPKVVDGFIIQEMLKGQIVPKLNPPGLPRCLKIPPLESVLSLKILCSQKAATKIRMRQAEMGLMQAIVLKGTVKRTRPSGSRFECWLGPLPLSYVTSVSCLTSGYLSITEKLFSFGLCWPEGKTLHCQVDRKLPLVLWGLSALLHSEQLCFGVFCFWPCCVVGFFVPQPGIKPGPSAGEVQTLNY